MGLERFTEAQKSCYETAREEIRNGRKRSHWMWYIFPQVRGLGFSETSRYYGIADRAEAEAYLAHPVLGQRLREMTDLLSELETADAKAVFGHPDHLKLRSCMTLFYLVSGEERFQKVLKKFFGGIPDARTVDLLADTEKRPRKR